MSKFDDFDNNFNDNEIEKAIRKGKRKSLIRNTIIALVISVITIILAIIINNIVYIKSSNEAMNKIDENIVSNYSPNPHLLSGTLLSYMLLHLHMSAYLQALFSRLQELFLCPHLLLNKS